MAKKPATKLQTYQWEGLDRKGKRIKGEQEAPNIAFVRAVLRRQGVRPKRIKRKAKPLFKLEKRVSPKDIALASRQLATMVGAGIPLAQGLSTLGRTDEHPKLARLFTTVRQEVEAGTNMSTVIARYPKHFDRLYTSLVRVGEQSGTLDNMLDKISIHMEKIEILKGKIRSAMFYPILVLIVAVVVVAVLLLFVIPVFEDLFQSVGADLPTLTRVVVDASNWFRQWWWIAVLLILGAIVICAIVYRRSETFRHTMDRLTLRIPIVGPVFRKAAIARIMRTLATMFSAGVPLVDSLEAVSDASKNRVYQQAMLHVRDEVSSGRQLEPAMSETKLFPNMVLQMINTGEESGELDVMMHKVADFFEREVDDAVNAMASLLEPAMIVFIGIVVGTIVIAMYLPIFKLASVF